MTHRFISLFAGLALLACWAAAPAGAAGIGLHHQRVAEKPAPARLASAPATPLIASPAACPGQTSLDAPVEAQETAMRCMVDYARREAGLEGLAEAEQLDASARSKAIDVLRCDEFSHFACDREFSYWIRATGYMSAPCWRVGENLAWGQDEFGTVQSIFLALMRSPTHRANVLGDYEEMGLSLRVGGLGTRGDTHVWTQHFGVQC